MTRKACRIIADIEIDCIGLTEESMYNDYKQIYKPWFKTNSETGKELGQYYNWLDTQLMI
jgi:hypothetical protein